MRLNETFARPLRQPPSDATTVNHRLLVEAGYVDQLMAGVFTYLPLGLRVLNNISDIVREEMNAIGGEEMLMPLLHPADIWKKSGGWDGVDVLFKLKSRTDKEGHHSYALAQSEEEVIAPLFLDKVLSTPWINRVKKPYNIHWKFRDELRAKSGILRGREFLMKDMYSFHENQKHFDTFYETVKKAYIKTFKRFDLTAKVTEASGGNFSDKISYEFEVLTDAGEDVIYYCEECDYCIEDEIAKVKPGDKCPNCDKGALKEAKAAEVGNVFDLGQKYAKAFNLMITTQKNERVHPIMGCYGIGISRVMGVIVEKHSDEKGIIWPESVAPYPVHIVRLGDDKKVIAAADKLYADLGENAVYDDRDETAGLKFNDADLIGIPNRVTVSQKTVDQQSAEVKRRDSKEAELVPLKDAVKKLS
jgi:prolyl-tRNA synthetase